MEKKFPKNTFSKRLGSMLSVDSRRMFTTPLFLYYSWYCSSYAYPYPRYDNSDGWLSFS